MKKLFVLVSLFIFSLLLGIKGSASDYYELGTHLEAEKYNVNNLTEINSNPNASGYKALDAGATGSVKYSVNMETAGKYRLALGYYSGGTKGKAALKVNVNGKEEVYQITTFNGWCKDTNILPIAYSVEVILNAGENTVIYGAAGEYVNLDYIAIYDVNDEYSPEEMHANLCADGSRIQAEWAVDVVGDFCDKNIAIKEKGSCTDGFTFSVDDDYLSKPGYVVNATSGGTYIFQVAFYGANNVTPKYLFNVNGTDHLITLPKSPANWNRNNYSTKASFEVELVEGKNVIYYSYARSGFADFDWFRLYKKDSNGLNDVIEAEDYILGDVNALKSSSKYSFVSNHVIELAQGSVDFEVSVDSAGSYVLYVSAYTGTNGAYQYININGKKSKLVYVNNGWIDDVNDEYLQEFVIELNSGVNKISISKGEDSIAYNYVDLDYFVISKGNVITEKIVLDHNNNPSVLLDSFITLDNYEVSVKDEDVVKIEDDKIVITGGGSTVIEVSYEVNGNTIIKKVPVVVLKADYKGDDISALDTVKEYTGDNCFVDVLMPSGWSASQTGNSNVVGEYEVTVTFTHPNYNPVVKKAMLIIEKTNYTGNDLYVSDASYDYDGDAKYVIASAPHGWNISYENNGQIEAGVYEVTITFSHQNYNDVVKTVRLTIVKSFNFVPVIVGGSIGLVVLGVVIFILKKKRK